MACRRSTPTAPADVVCVGVQAAPSSIDRKTAITPTFKTLPPSPFDIAHSIDNAQRLIFADIRAPNPEKNDS